MAMIISQRYAGRLQEYQYWQPYASVVDVEAMLLMLTAILHCFFIQNHLTTVKMESSEA
jgi:hypothetical protein